MLRRVLPAGLFLLLPLAAAISMLSAFGHLSDVQEQDSGSLAVLRDIEDRATHLRWQWEAVASGAPASAVVLGERAGEFSSMLASVGRVRFHGDAGAEDEAASVQAAWTRLDEEWAHVQELLPEVASSPAGSRELAELGERGKVHAAHLEMAVHDLVAGIEAFERESMEADIARLSLLTVLLLLAFGGFSLVLFVRTAQVREREGQIQRLALVAEHAGSGMILADDEGRVLWANAACGRMLGWPSGTISGVNVCDVLTGGGHGEAADVIGDALRSRRVLRAELSLRGSDGRPFWGEVEVAPVWQVAQRPGDYIVTFRDISKRRQALEALSESEGRFRSALESMAEGLIIQGADGAFHTCNSAAARILGLSEDQIHGLSAMDARWAALREDGTDFPGEEHPITVAQRTGRPVSGAVMGVRRPDGSVVWISVEANAIRREGADAPVGAVATFLDVTARRNAELELRKLMQAVEQSPAACIITNARREIEYVNRCFEESTGWRKDELIGRNPRVLASGQTPKDVYRAMWQALSNGEKWTGELINHRKSGESYRSRMTAFPLRDAAGVVTHYVSFSEDVTAEHLREQELSRAREEALAAARAKSEFLQNMSHELRTPMNGILGMADLLRQSDLSAPQRADLDTLRSSADQLLTVISQLFDFTRLESDGAAETHVAFRLRNCLQPVATKLASSAESRSLACRFDVAPSVPDWLVGDPGGLRQVLLHLTDNALKFTDRGEVVVLVTGDPDDGSRAQVRFEVRDTGIGIPPDRQDAIFDAFEQADGSSTRKYGGLGLGLTLARRIVHRLGGRLLVSSEPGRGSTFAFTLPFHLASASSQPEAAPVAAPAGRPVLLLVDGGGAARTHAVEALAGAGADVQVVPGAEGAIALIRETAGTPAAPCVVLLDERGGGLEPFTAARRLRDALADALPPVAVVAVAGQRGDAERCRELGVQAYLTQPLGANDLHEAVHRLLRQGRNPARDGELLTRHVLREERRQVRVLLVEDNAVNRKVATRLLERSGFRVGIGEDGRAGFDKYREGGWDVVLMDMQMPVMDGIESARCIREWEREQGLPRVPIVAVTAHTLDGDREAARDAGMDGFVSKPIQPDELLRTIRDCVGESPDEAEGEAARPGLREVLDWDEALERMDGDEMVLHELLRLFLQDSGNMMERLEEARSSGDAKRIERAAHGLKGASATISARAVAPLAREIETLAREGELVKALDLMDSLRVEMLRLRRALEALPESGRKAA